MSDRQARFSSTLHGHGPVDRSAPAQGLAADHVTFRTRRLEPLVPLALAVATAWFTAIQSPDQVSAWICALAALVIWGWSRSYPARSAWLMLVRAGFLLTLSVALHVDAGRSELTLLWPVLVACGYGLLLRTALATLVLLLAFGGFALAMFLAGTAGTRLMLTDAGLFLVPAVVAMAFGRSMLRSDFQMEASFMDPHTGLYNRAGLLAYGNELVSDSLHRDRALCLVLLHCKDLGDVRDLLGRKTASAMFAHAIQGIAKSAPKAGMVARTDRLEFVMVLPGLDSAKSKALVHAALGAPPALRMTTEGRTLEVVVDATVVSLSRGVDDMEALYQLAQAKLRNRHAPEDEQESILSESGGPLSRLEISPTLPMPL